MYAILGAAGKVGFATASTLRAAHIPVRAILRDPSKAHRLTTIGCEIAIADLQDADALARAIGDDAEVVQVILPPAPANEDTAAQMRTAIESIAQALEKVKGVRRVLAVSDYGAHVRGDIGMPTVCREFEERLRRAGAVKGWELVVLRSAEHMQGWGRVRGAVEAAGVLPSFHDPVDVEFPTVAAGDVGVVAAEILLEREKERGPKGEGGRGLEVVHVEGPRRYSARDVARTVGGLMGREVDVVPVPRGQWKETLEKAMSPSMAELLIKANDAQNQGGLVEVEQGGVVRYGKTELVDALRPLFT